MAVETERKFLVTGEYKHLAYKKSEIIQGYLSSGPSSVVRVRIQDETARLGIKSKPLPGHFTRGEWEYEIASKEAREIIEKCKPPLIQKTRYFIENGPHVIEVDEFHGVNEGLTVAEIELLNESDSFIKPDWLGEEVTCNPAYFNSNLAR